MGQQVREIGAGVSRGAASQIPPPPTRRLKRAFDAVLAGTGLLLSAPLWGLFALVIKLEDRGPVFVKQDRVGYKGSIFRVLKFRSMTPDAETEWGPIQAAAGDPRVTHVGRFLRATALDELPQLWNILVGDMSFVGPRALRPCEIEVSGNGEAIPLEATPGYEKRHRIRPGLTGIAQVYAPRDVVRRNKFRYDLLYIKKQSFLLDLKVILISVWITLRGRWEARNQKF